MFHLSLEHSTICRKNATNLYKVADAKTMKSLTEIDYVDELESYVVTCSNKFDSSFDLELPIGYQSFNKTQKNGNIVTNKEIPTLLYTSIQLMI